MTHRKPSHFQYQSWRPIKRVAIKPVVLFTAGRALDLESSAKARAREGGDCHDASQAGRDYKVTREKVSGGGEYLDVRNASIPAPKEGKEEEQKRDCRRGSRKGGEEQGNE